MNDEQVALECLSELESAGSQARELCHDLNNHLTIIRTFSELLSGSLAADDACAGFNAEVLEASERAIERLGDLRRLLGARRA